MVERVAAQVESMQNNADDHSCIDKYYKGTCAVDIGMHPRI